MEKRVSLHHQWPPSCFSGGKCGWTRWIIRSVRVSLNGSLTDRRFHDAFHGESLRVALETFCFLNPQEWVIYDIYDTLKVWIKTPDSLKLFPRIALGCFFRHLKNRRTTWNRDQITPKKQAQLSKLWSNIRSSLFHSRRYWPRWCPT